MANLKSLAKDTAIYGLSSIIGRFLNYLLVPLYTAKISAASGGYGVITNMYAYTALLLVILTYGMETTFFRFVNKEGENSEKVYHTVLSMVGFTSLLFIALVFLFIAPLSDAMGYADHPAYVWTMFVTVAIDAFQCIPFAYLRYKKRPLKFAAFKLLFIGLNIALNLVYYVIMDGHDVGYAFYINLVCTASITFCFYKELKEGFMGEKCSWSECKVLVRKMMGYSWPILVLGIAGILNQTADKILFPYIYEKGDAHAQLGIYGAASKIAMIMAMITQAFRYAYEPFVFGKAEESEVKMKEADANVKSIWNTEWLSMQMGIKTVASEDEALDHIATYGSGHSESIVSNDEAAQKKFQAMVDAACVYVNAPTSFHAPAFTSSTITFMPRFIAAFCVLKRVRRLLLKNIISKVLFLPNS